MRSERHSELSRLRRLTNGLVDGGASFSGMERNHLFVNQSGTNFAELSGVSGLDSLADARTNARFDFDRDGFVDIGLVNANTPLLNIFRNNLGDGDTRNNFIAVRFHGGNRNAVPVRQWSARDGYGVSVRVRVGSQLLLRELRAGEGFAAQNSKTMLIGLGQCDRATSMEVRWPSGRRQTISAVPASSLVNVYEDPSEIDDDSGFVLSSYRLGRTKQQWAQQKSREKLPLKVDRKARLSIYVTVATWCQSCRNELPRLQEILETLSPGTVATFGIPIDPNDSRKKLEMWNAKYSPPLRLLFDLSEQQRNHIQEILKQRTASPDTVPSTIIADPNGTVRAVFPGPPTLSQIRELLDG